MNFNKALQVIEEEVCSLIESSNSALVVKCNKLLNNLISVIVADSENMKDELKSYMEGVKNLSLDMKEDPDNKENLPPPRKKRWTNPVEEKEDNTFSEDVDKVRPMDNLNYKEYDTRYMKSDGRFIYCNQCRYRTHKKARMTLHVKSIHLKIYDHRCNMCHYKTVSKGNLTYHLK